MKKRLEMTVLHQIEKDKRKDSITQNIEINILKQITQV